jgi:hypothetical protein
MTSAIGTSLLYCLQGARSKKPVAAGAQMGYCFVCQHRYCCRTDSAHRYGFSISKVIKVSPREKCVSKAPVRREGGGPVVRERGACMF